MHNCNISISKPDQNKQTKSTKAKTNKNPAVTILFPRGKSGSISHEALCPEGKHSNLLRKPRDPSCFLRFTGILASIYLILILYFSLMKMLHYISLESFLGKNLFIKYNSFYLLSSYNVAGASLIHYLNIEYKKCCCRH